MEGRQHGFKMLRPDIEYHVNSGIDHHHHFDDDGDSEMPELESGESITLVDSKVTGIGEYAAPLKVVYTKEAVTLQIDLHTSDLPLVREEVEALVETQDQLTLSEMGDERYEIYEYTVIDTVANELGKYYDGDNSQAVKGRDEATLVYPSENVVETVSDPNVFPFCCQLDPDKFWELS